MKYIEMDVYCRIGACVVIERGGDAATTVRK